jgi:hypothetical protein
MLLVGVWKRSSSTAHSSADGHADPCRTIASSSRTKPLFRSFDRLPLATQLICSTSLQTVSEALNSTRVHVDMSRAAVGRQEHERCRQSYTACAYSAQPRAHAYTPHAFTHTPHANTQHMRTIPVPASAAAFAFRLSLWVAALLRTFVPYAVCVCVCGGPQRSESLPNATVAHSTVM